MKDVFSFSIFFSLLLKEFIEGSIEFSPHLCLFLSQSRYCYSLFSLFLSLILMKASSYNDFCDLNSIISTCNKCEMPLAFFSSILINKANLLSSLFISSSVLLKFSLSLFPYSSLSHSL
jgi:hypothetical protein